MKIKNFVVAFGMVAGLLAFAAPAPAQAINVFQACSGNSSSKVCSSSDDSATNVAKNVINTLIYIIGIAAVIMIVVGGLRYVISNGDSGKVKTAKDTILYAVVGLVIAILSFAIVNFVLSNI